MGKKEFERKTRDIKPVIAICYDFDKTLSSDKKIYTIPKR